MTVGECLALSTLTLSPNEKIIADELLKESINVCNSSSKSACITCPWIERLPTLSGGEAQRVRLRFADWLRACRHYLYFRRALHRPPSIATTRKLIRTLKHLRDMGNTVIVVEHDEETIWEADACRRLRPRPWSASGRRDRRQRRLGRGLLRAPAFDHRRLSCAGSMAILHSQKSGASRGKETLQISGAAHHNLKNVSV